MLGLKRRRREKIRNGPFPAEWLERIEKNVPLYRRLDATDQKELRGHILVFLAEKNFEGCGGLELSEEIKVTIAAQACILLLHREDRLLSRALLDSCLPWRVRSQRLRGTDAPASISETEQVHLGESWKHGWLILSWDDVLANASDIHDGHNVVLHEFAHQLDSEDGRANGAPPLPHRSMYLAWARILGKDFVRLRHEAQEGLPTVLDQYGATNPAEFFAVATECFFEKPVQLQSKHPELYERLKLYFRQDPALFAPQEEEE